MKNKEQKKTVYRGGKLTNNGNILAFRRNSSRGSCRNAPSFRVKTSAHDFSGDEEQGEKQGEEQGPLGSVEENSNIHVCEKNGVVGPIQLSHSSVDMEDSSHPSDNFPYEPQEARGRNGSGQADGILGRNGRSNTAGTKMVFANETESLFSQKAERKALERDRRVETLKNRLRESTATKVHIQAYVRREQNRLRTEWPALFKGKPKRIYVHMDMDSFFASVEALSEPEHKNKPMAVGSKMMLAAVNYPARLFGIKSGMPGYEALRLFPELKIVRPNISKYKFYSDAIMNILCAYDQELEVYSIDEACLAFDEDKLRRAFIYYNNSGHRRYSTQSSTCEEHATQPNASSSPTLGSEALEYSGFDIDGVSAIVQRIRAVVYRKTGLTISAGISVCRGLAKLSSKVNKPNGQHAIPGKFNSFILDRGVSELNGIGTAMQDLLSRALGIYTVRDLRASLDRCAVAFRHRTFSYLLRLSFGLSPFDTADCVKHATEALSHSASVTIQPTCRDKDILFYLWQLSETVERRMAQANKAGSRLTLTVKFVTFDAITKRRNNFPVMITGASIFENSLVLLNQLFPAAGQRWSLPDKIRLVGLAVGDLINTSTINTLEKYKGSTGHLMEQTCFACGRIFMNISHGAFEAHVNHCLDLRAGMDLQAERDSGRIGGIEKNTYATLPQYNAPLAEKAADRACFLCNRSFPNLAQLAFEVHVNNCLDSEIGPKLSSMADSRMALESNSRMEHKSSSIADSRLHSRTCSGRGGKGGKAASTLFQYFRHRK